MHYKALLSVVCLDAYDLHTVGRIVGVGVGVRSRFDENKICGLWRPRAES
jgi:hypothetical protein